MIQLTKEQALQRLDSNNNLCNIMHKRDWSRQRNGNGNNGRAGKFTKDEKEGIVILASELGNKETAEIVGCHPASIPPMKEGISSHRSEVNVPSTHKDKSIVEKNQERISERSVEKVLRSLDLITDDKLKISTAVELSTIASRLSNINGRRNEKGGPAIQVNIVTPGLKNESQFETIVVQPISED